MYSSLAKSFKDTIRTKMNKKKRRLSSLKKEMIQVKRLIATLWSKSKLRQRWS